MVHTLLGLAVLLIAASGCAPLPEASEGALNESGAALLIDGERRQVKLAGDRAYYTTSTGIWSVALDGRGSAVRHVQRFAQHVYPWTVDGEHVYYVPDYQASRVRRAGIADGSDALFFELGRDRAVHALSSDDAHVFIEVQMAGVAATTWISVDKHDGSTADGGAIYDEPLY